VLEPPGIDSVEEALVPDVVVVGVPEPDVKPLNVTERDGE